MSPAGQRPGRYPETRSDGSVHGCVKVRKGGCRRRVSQVIRGTYTACTEVIEPVLVEVIRSAERPSLPPGSADNLPLKAYAQQCGYFRTGQGVTIDVVNESRTSRPSSRNFSAMVRPVRARADGFPAARSSGHTPGILCHNVGVGHFVVEVVTLTSTFTTPANTE